MLYQQHPIDWIEENPADDKDQWLEQTLSAAGIGHSDAPAQEYEYGYDYYDQDDYEYSSSSSLEYGHGSSSDRSYGRGLLEEPTLSPSSAGAASAVTSRRRPQSLRSSNVPLPRPVSMELPVALQSYLSTVFDVDWSVGLANEKRPPFGKQSPSPPSATGVADSPRHDAHAQQDASRHATKLQQSIVRQDTQPQHDTTHDSSRNNPEQSQQTHIHNHIHIHIHNYPPDGPLSSTSTSTSTSSERSCPPPVIRSSRYPKQQLQATVSSREHPHSQQQHSHSHAPRGAIHNRHDDKAPMSANDLHSYISEFPSPPSKTQQSYTTPVAIEAAGPITAPTPTSFASSSISTASSSSAVYPPEKPVGHISNPEEEQPYIATAPPVPSRYSRSPPPPPYTQTFEDTPESKYEDLSYPRPMKQVQPPTFSTPIKPQMPIPSSLVLPSPSPPSPYSSASQKLIEYQKYQERQKMFLRDEETKDPRSGDGLGFIKQLFKQNPKKKKPVAVISAPLSSTTSSLLLGSHTPYLIQDVAQRNKLSAVPSVRTRSERML
ncbi:hypothetical protein BGZ58_007819 [Dissophora ornata]|nr:hypothetical protein BGZ58_007819 [Dissophora ornata]